MYSVIKVEANQRIHSCKGRCSKYNLLNPGILKAVASEGNNKDSNSQRDSSKKIGRRDMVFNDSTHASDTAHLPDENRRYEGFQQIPSQYYRYYNCDGGSSSGDSSSNSSISSSSSSSSNSVIIISNSNSGDTGTSVVNSVRSSERTTPTNVTTIITTTLLPPIPLLLLILSVFSLLL